MQLNERELLKVTGGVAVSAALFASIARLGSFALELGRAFGSAIRRSASGNKCPL